MKKIFCASFLAMSVIVAAPVFAAGSQLEVDSASSVQQYYHCGSGCNGYYGRGGCGRYYSDSDAAYCDDNGYCGYRRGRR